MSQVDTSILCFTVLQSTMLHIHCFYSESESHSVVSSSLWPHRLQPTRLLCPWHSPGQNTRVGNCSLLQGIFSTQESKTGLPHYRHLPHYLPSEPPGKVYDNAACIKQVCWCHFPISIFSLCVSVSRFGNSHSISNFLVIISCHNGLWTVIFYVTIAMVCGGHKSHPHETVNLIDKCCVCSIAPLTKHSLSFSFSSGLLILWDTTILKLGQLIALQWSLDVEVKESHVSISLWIKS